MYRRVKKYLLSAVHQWHAGLPFTSQVSSRATLIDNLNMKTTLSSSDLVTAVTGFASRMKFKKEDWACIDCGDTPKYIVADGKCNGPASRHIQHLRELEKHPNDTRGIINYMSYCQVADTIILQATTTNLPTHNFSHLKCQSSVRKPPFMTFYDLLCNLEFE